MGGLVAGRIKSVRLGCRNPAVTQPARPQGRAAGNQAQKKFTTSILHGSVLATAGGAFVSPPLWWGSSMGQKTAGSVVPDRSAPSPQQYVVLPSALWMVRVFL
ncbi:MAG: hypothetical protein Ct9H300mP1_05500 [Planctomycetaceae bacterium]|nr:MAG: hypothetical protein Ct9H300mP1_05500 [Planctomycetaceae bacterium]